MKKISIFFLILAICVGFNLTPAQAQGDGYTDCEKDPVYERSFNASPNIGLYLRTRACMTESPIITTLKQGQVYQVIAETDGWYKVKLSDGTTGWAGSGLMTKTSASVDNTSNETVKTTDSSPLQARVRGYILLQVEDNGEAWYVHPVDGYRYYMKNGAVAYEMMRSFGLGISNADLLKAQNGDLNIVGRIKGRILLQVEANGEAFYVHPKDGALHYLKNGDEAYKIMRELSLGITNKDLSQVPAKGTVPEVTKNSTSPTTPSNGTIVLNGYSADNDIYLSWSTNGFTSVKGYKIVKSLQPNPVYPGDTYHYLSDSSANSDTWNGFNTGETYHFRVCEYLGGACGVYSNDFAITVQGASSNASGSIILSLNYLNQGTVGFSWTTSGFVAEKGFKVVMSTKPNPVYPGDLYHYFNDPNKNSDQWTGLNSNTTYHFRICEYLGGACGIYSNDVSVTTPSGY